MNGSTTNEGDRAVQVKFSLSKKAVLIILIPFLLQILVLVQSGILVMRVERLARQEYYSKAMVNHANWIVILLSVAANSLAAYSANGDERYLSSYQACLNDIPQSFSETFTMLQGQSAQTTALNKFQTSIDKAVSRLKTDLPDARSGKSAEILRDLSNIQSTKLWSNVIDARRELLASNTRASFNDPEALPAARNLQKIILGLIFLLDAGSAVFLIYVFNSKLGDKLNILAQNASLLGARKSLLPPLRGNDEISILDSALHEASAKLDAAERQLKESEERLRQVIDNMPIGLMTVDQQGNTDIVNPEVARILRKEPASLVGKSLADVLPAIDRTLIGAGSNQEMHVESKDKPIILDVSERSYPIGSRTLSLLVLHDITARKELQQMRQEIVNMVSHAPRSPLTALSFFLNLLSRGAYGTVNERGQENVSRAERNVERLLKMVSDLLDFEKMQAGFIQLDMEPLAVNEVVRAAADLIEGVAKKSDMYLEVNAPSCWIIGDKERLVQVLVNLLSNAMKFSPTGSTITIDAEATSHEVEIRVIDRGRGVPPQMLDQIFQKYKQTEEADAKVKKGVGLGLPICKWLIEHHGGTIGVRSIAGQGSTFWIRLKRAETSAETALHQ